MARPDTYTKEEEEFIINNYPSMPWDELMAGINNIGGIIRGKQNIIVKANRLGVKRGDVRCSKYTEEEDTLLREVFENSTEHELGKNLKVLKDTKMPYRTIGSLQTRAAHLGLHIRDSWSDEEKQFIIDNYLTMATGDMAEHLGRTSNAVYLMVKKLGLSGAPNYKYTPKEINFITENYTSMSDIEMGNILHRSSFSIKNLRNSMGMHHRDPDAATHYANIMRYIDRYNADWKKRSMESCGYKCVLTNDKFDEVHHLYAKNLIIDTVLTRMGISRDIDINNCDEEFKRKVLDEFYKEQDKHPLGVCLAKDVHHSFHVLYGFGGNTPEQFYEFAKRYPQNRLSEVIK